MRLSILLATLAVAAPAAAADCPPELALTAGTDATVTLDVMAGCAPGARVTIGHAGLVVTDRLDARGRLSLSLPALTPDAAVTVTLPPAAPVTASVHVPEAATRDRFVFQWLGDGDPDLRAISGVISVLGAPGVSLPLRAQVLTVVTGGTLAPELLVPVTRENCDGRLVGETLVVRHGEEVARRDITVSLPSCAAAGDHLIVRGLADVTGDGLQ